jgi:hypothetical protein
MLTIERCASPRTSQPNKSRAALICAPDGRNGITSPEMGRHIIARRPELALLRASKFRLQKSPNADRKMEGGSPIAKAWGARFLGVGGAIGDPTLGALSLFGVGRLF